ncbi:inhibitor of nuclear factor kappa-B kinase subunit beta-like [Sycon ciliatum]|uniref:inhibitor of nuclear factor kappa-B kinase subunit beta-like n=1 Tax=Sycon ciliatum TaxID=27933 RepID=UPI0031F69540
MEKLAKFRKSDPSAVFEFKDFVYHQGSVLGKGSYGKVYHGWVKPHYEEVAVKVIKSEFYENDAKVRENLYREIDIQEDLKECRNVVRLHCRLETPEGLYLVMEKCDYDLQHHLNAVKALNEAATKDFLFQLGSGIEYMHMKGIVHRDLKPANVLLVRDGTGGVVVKLADFGFARHFRIGEGTKPIDMNSLAGTPVFMAPEALECVFYKGKHYDEKVDMWSIGAVLYQCLVGRPAFYAQLQDILPILKKKGDAIAFRRGRSGQIQYIKELPSDVEGRMTKRFKMQMNQLLKHLLQVSPSKRISYGEFFLFIDQLNRTPLDVYCPSTGGKYSLSFAIENPCKEIGKLIHVASGIEPADQILFDLGSGAMIDPLGSRVLSCAVLQKTDHWTFFVLSKKHLASEDQPHPDEEYVHTIVKTLDEPSQAIGVVQAEGLSVMCSEMVESANEIRQMVTNALVCYRNIVKGTQQLLYDIRTDLRLERSRYEHGCGALVNTMEEDLRQATEDGQVSTSEHGVLNDQLLTMKAKYAAVMSAMDEVEDQCTMTHDSMMAEDGLQSLSPVQGDLSPLLEECRRITHFKGQLLISSAKALVNQCRQKHAAFLRVVHSKFRLLYNYAHTVPHYQGRVAQLASRSAAVWQEIKSMRRRFSADLFSEIAQSHRGGFQAASLDASVVSAGPGLSVVAKPVVTVATTTVPAAGDGDEVDGVTHTPQLQQLIQKNDELALDKNQLLHRVDELEQQLHALQTTGPAAGSIWEMIGSTGVTIDQVTGTFPVNHLQPCNPGADAAHMTLPFPSPTNLDRTLVPGSSGEQQPLSGSSSPSATVSPPRPLAEPRHQSSPRDDLNLESIRLSLSQLLGFTQKLQEIVSYQPSTDDEATTSSSADAVAASGAGADAGAGGGFMDTWRAATDVSGLSMLNETKLVDSIQTLVDLSNFVETDALKSAVRDMAKHISYKHFAVGQIVLFLALSKKGVYVAFHDSSSSSSSVVSSSSSRSPGPLRYFLKSSLTPTEKNQWALGVLKSPPKLEKSTDTRNPYGQPRFSSYYILEARVFLAGDL